MRSWVQVLETASCRNAGKGCVHKTQSGRTLPRTLCKRELHAPGCPFLCISSMFHFEMRANSKLLLTIFIFRCQIAVHQECYGVRGQQDFTSWVCRACEKPEKKECCLCPVRGNPCAFVKRAARCTYLLLAALQDLGKGPTTFGLMYAAFPCISARGCFQDLNP